MRVRSSPTMAPATRISCTRTSPTLPLLYSDPASGKHCLCATERHYASEPFRRHAPAPCSQCEGPQCQNVYVQRPQIEQWTWALSYGQRWGNVKFTDADINRTPIWSVPPRRWLPVLPPTQCVYSLTQTRATRSFYIQFADELR